MNEETKELIRRITRGAFDDELNVINDAVHARRKLLRQHDAEEARLTLQVGDRGTLTGLRPQYVNGAEVEIIEPPARTRVLVKILTPNPRIAARFGGAVKIPLTSFVPVNGG